MLDFEHSILGNPAPKAEARQCAERTIVQIRRDVYDSHRHRAFALAFYMTGNELEAENLLARCFTRAFAARDVPDGGDVDTSLLTEMRADGILGELELRTLPEAGAALEARENILRTDLEEALGELNSAERLVFLLSDVEGYRPAAVAELMGMQEPAILRALTGARLRLRQVVAALQKKHARKA